MKHVYFLAPAGRGQGLTTVALGIVEALDRRGVRVAFYKPINENVGECPEPERSTHFLRAITTLAPVDPLPLPHHELELGVVMPRRLGVASICFGDVAERDPVARLLFSGTFGDGLFRWMAAHGWIHALDDGAPLVRGIPKVLIWWAVLAAACSFQLTRTRFGNWIFAVGGDAGAAKNVGVPVKRVKVSLFMFTALCAWLFAMLQICDVGSAAADRGLQKEFEAVIAAVIGGSLLTGGYGSVIGACFGALIFGVVQIGITYTNINADWFRVFLGLMLLLAVLFNHQVRRRITQTR